MIHNIMTRNRQCSDKWCSNTDHILLDIHPEYSSKTTKLKNSVCFPKCEDLSNSAFCGCNQITSINLPICDYINDGTDYIGTFYNCTSLHTCLLPDCIYVGSNAFSGCTSLSTIYIPKCTSIGKNSFDKCINLSSVVLGVSMMYQSTLSASDTLSYISCPQCQYIDISTFYNYTQLTSIAFPECLGIEKFAFGNTPFSEVDMFVYTMDAFTSNNINAYYNYYNEIFSTTSLSTIFPKLIEGTSTSTSGIYHGLFAGGTFSSITFSNCSYLRDGIINVLSGVFEQCIQLEIASFPKCTYIGNQAFYHCSNLSILTFPECSYIGYSAFENTKVVNISFSKCYQIQNNAFKYCSLLESVVLQKCISIGNWGFAYCSSLQSINIPYCKFINNWGFAYCSSLSEIIIPKCLQINENAFKECSNLSTIYLPLQKICTLVNSNAFEGTMITSSTGSICVPTTLITKYKTSPQWSYFSNQFVTL